MRSCACLVTGPHRRAVDIVRRHGRGYGRDRWLSSHKTTLGGQIGQLGAVERGDFLIRLTTWKFAVVTLMPSAAAISRFVRPRTRIRSTSVSRGGNGEFPGRTVAFDGVDPSAGVLLAEEIGQKGSPIGRTEGSSDSEVIGLRADHAIAQDRAVRSRSAPAVAAATWSGRSSRSRTRSLAGSRRDGEQQAHAALEIACGGLISWFYVGGYCPGQGAHVRMSIRSLRELMVTMNSWLREWHSLACAIYPVSTRRTTACGPRSPQSSAPRCHSATPKDHHATGLSFGCDVPAVMSA